MAQVAFVSFFFPIIDTTKASLIEPVLFPWGREKVRGKGTSIQETIMSTSAMTWEHTDGTLT